MSQNQPFENPCTVNENDCQNPPEEISSNNSIRNNESTDIDQNPKSPNKKTRKRLRNPVAWKKNQRAQLKNSGQEYISRTGKIIPAKVIKPPCSNKCKYKCSERISEEQRCDIFKMYWDFSSLQRQRDFLNSTITVLQLPQRRLKTGVEKNRKPNTYCSLMCNGRSFRVCKLFLLNTLGISERTLRTVIESKTSNESKGVAPIDKRGCHENHGNTSSEVKESVRVHINSISRIESHYLRCQHY